MSAVQALAVALERSALVQRIGRIVAVRGHILESIGPSAQIGERCRIERRSGAPLEAEVAGFAGGVTWLTPFAQTDGVAPGDRVTALDATPSVPVGRELLGRVIDAFGRSVDGGPPLHLREQRPLRAAPLKAMDRKRVTAVFETGVKVIDSMLTLARGQRIGLFAGSGVGKSSLLGMMARSARSSVNVVALIGERSREVREFIEDSLGEQGLRRSVVVVATADEPAVVRTKAAYAATVIAEFFRDAGEDVLLMMDSLTRFAMARREIGLAAGEPPTTRGYTPSTFAELPQLCERSGPGAGAGAITGVYTVLVDGDDLNEPVSDALRATLDGHIILSRDLANSAQYPAIDVLRSVSRLLTVVAAPDDVACARRLLSACALFERNRQLIEIGAYKPGVNAALDRAVQAAPRIRTFFSQAHDDQVPRERAMAQMRELAAALGRDDEQ